MYEYVKGEGIIPFASAPRSVTVTYAPDGEIRMRSPIPLSGVRRNLVEYLRHWAEAAPNRTFLAEADRHGGWSHLSYAEAWRRVVAIGSWIIEEEFDAERAVAILSPPSIEHALVMLGAMAVGRTVAPISPSYSLLPAAFGRLEAIAELLRPALIFAQEPAAYARDRRLRAFSDAVWIGAETGDDALALQAIENVGTSRNFERAFDAVSHATVGKILFTSGSTGAPKGVINTHGMMCSSIAGTGLVLPVDAPPTIVDWLPWHHTMGGNVNLHGTMRDGGTLYIDGGKPTAQDFGKTLAALRQIPQTWTHAVPLSFAMLADEMDRDQVFRDAYFSRLRYMIYAGSGLKSELWRRVQEHCVAATGRNIAFFGGYGTTETGPTIAIAHWFTEGVGQVGLPVPGVEVRLIPLGDGRYELRVRGPTVTPGYFKQPELTQSAFDCEGYYRTGDTVRFVEKSDPALGLLFAGRVAESFKLSNGSWVSPGELRALVLEATSPWINDIVVAGHERDDVRVLLWPSPAGLALSKPELMDRVGKALRLHNETNGSQSHRIVAYALLDDPPSVEAGELTEKGSINQRAALAHRMAAVRALYDETGKTAEVQARDRWSPVNIDLGRATDGERQANPGTIPSNQWSEVQ